MILLAPAPALAGLLEKNHPKVEQGNQAFAKGDFDGALRAYEDAERELPPSAELLYNKGAAFMKLGRADDAKRAFQSALSGAKKDLRPRDLYNLGNALATLNQKDDAIAAYRQALKADPSFEPARHNLEVLLRQKQPPPPKPQPGDGGTPDSGTPDSGSSDGGAQDGGGRDGGMGDAGQTDAGGGDGGRGDGGQGDAGKGDGGQGDGGSGSQDQSGQADGGAADASTGDGGSTGERPPEEQEEAKEIDKQEAERLLDALRQNEKQFLMLQKQKGKQRARPEKDW